jgi:low temperature requirement protein LtrA
MAPRDPEEDHRASTPLELLFDLCFVVAVSQAAGQLHHGLLEGQVAASLRGYAEVFFAIWWAWMNFTWFASAYDTDDVPYRLLTLLQMSGVLILAAGIPDAANHGDFATIVVGYVVMRLAMVTQWLRAAAGDPDRRVVAHHYAIGVAVLQVFWISWLWVPEGYRNVTFLVLAVLEMLVPVWAERAGPMTSWHPEHIAERYGLFTLIVLGESVLAATVAVQSSISTEGVSPELLGVSGGALLLLFGIWWSYFDRPFDEVLRDRPQLAFPFGYAHYLVFASVAALGAGIQVAAETAHHVGELSSRGAALAVGIPVAVYLVVTAVLFDRFDRERSDLISSLVKAALILVIALVVGPSSLAWSVLLMGLVMALGLARHLRAAHQASLVG